MLRIVLISNEHFTDNIKTAYIRSQHKNKIISYPLKANQAASCVLSAQKEFPEPSQHIWP